MVQIVVLIGNICGGKTTFAKLLEKEGFKFFPVEEVKQKINFKEKEYDKNQELLYEEYCKQILEFGKKQKIIVESTGANKSWKDCFEKIKKEFGKELITIFIKSNKDICLSRLKENKIGHRENTREGLIKKVDEVLSSNKYFDEIIENNGSKEDFVIASKELILNKF